MLDLDLAMKYAEAHEANMKSALWAEDDPVVEYVDLEEQVEERAGSADEPYRVEESLAPAFAPASEILLHLDAHMDELGQRLAELAAAVAGIHVEQPVREVEAPAWLQAAMGDPQAYDAPDAARESVCIRVLPATHARLREFRARLGLRTMVGTWECLLRLGLAAAERLPARGS